MAIYTPTASGDAAPSSSKKSRERERFDGKRPAFTALLSFPLARSCKPPLEKESRSYSWNGTVREKLPQSATGPLLPNGLGNSGLNEMEECLLLAGGDYNSTKDMESDDLIPDSRDGITNGDQQVYIQALPDTRDGVDDRMDDPLSHSIRIEGPTTVNENREELKHAQNFGYCSISIASAGIVGIVCLLVQGQTGHTDRLYLKICILLFLAAFISSAFMIWIADPRRSGYSNIKIMEAFECTTLGLLILAIVSLAFIFLKIIILVVVVPILLLVFVLYRQTYTTTT